ncbi:MAG: hypothetical protein EA403_01800 [Spirochaetaceae bacterium]|nr:MAG: hypothetical protein EA403_01800 [Spirochaetaceae bacterium]
MIHRRGLAGAVPQSNEHADFRRETIKRPVTDWFIFVTLWEQLIFVLKERLRIKRYGTVRYTPQAASIHTHGHTHGEL